MRWLLVIASILAVATARADAPGDNETSRDSVEPREETGAVSAGNDSANARAYTLAKESRFEVRTGKGGLLGGVAHEHVVRAGSFTGAMTYDAGDPARSSFEITVPVNDLQVLTPAGESDRKKIRESMLTKVLDAKRYPEIHFVSRKVEARPQGAHIEGDLTLVGKTRPIAVDVAVKEQGDSLTVSGSFSVKQSDFGIKPYSAAMGTIKVADRVTFDFEAIGTR